MLSRSAAITAFSNLDTTLMNRLLQVATTIIIPDSDSLISVTFNDMVQKAHDLADVYFPEWTDRTKADFGELLVELMALYSEKDFYYVNAWSNEGFLQKAKGYSNVYYHALRVGYKPVRDTSNNAAFSLTFTQDAGNNILLSPGDIEITLADGNIYTNGDYITIPYGTGSYTTVRTLYSGQVQYVQTPFNGRSIRVLADAVDYTSVSFGYNGQFWNLVDSFAGSDTNSTDFMVLPTDGDEFEIVFGMDGFGMRPPVNALCDIYYRGSVNGSAVSLEQACTITKNTPTNLLTAVTMGNDASGGSESEPIESIRQNASLLFSTRGNNCIRNHTDCINILKAMPDVYNATAFNFANQLYFAVIPKNGTVATTTFLSELTSRIKDIVIEGWFVNGSLTTYATLSEVTMIAYVLNEFDPSDVEAQILDYFSYITDPLQGAQYGTGLDLGLAEENLVAQIEGLNNVQFLTVNGLPAASVVLTPLQIFNAVVTGDINITVVQIA